MQSASRVGLLVIVFVGLLFGAYSMLGVSLLSKPTDQYFAKFSDAAGTAAGTRILLAGVRIGTVTEVKLLNPRQALVSMKIDRDVKIPSGSSAVIPSSLIGLGDTSIELVPTSSAVIALPGTTFDGRKTDGLGGIMPKAEVTLSELNKTLVAFRALLTDAKLKNGIDQTLATTNKTLAQFGNLASRLDATIVQNQSEIGKTVASARRVVDDVHQASAAIARMVNEGKIKNDTYAILDSIKSISARADNLVSSLDRLVNDPKFRGPAEEIAKNVQKMTETGNRVATNAEKISADGTVVSKNAITLSEQAKEIATHAIEIEKQLQQVLDKVGGFFVRPKVGPTLGKVSTEYSLLHGTRPSRSRIDFEANIALSEGALNVGVWDALESNKLTIQYAKPLTPTLDYRYGVYASKPGFGVDYALTPRVNLRGDVWDINSPRFDLKARYEIGNGLIGWIGMERIFSKTAPMIGLGIRK